MRRALVRLLVLLVVFIALVTVLGPMLGEIEITALGLAFIGGIVLIVRAALNERRTHAPTSR